MKLACVLVLTVLTPYLVLAQDDKLYAARRAMSAYDLPELRAHLEGKRGYNLTIQERTDLISYASKSQSLAKDMKKWASTVDLLLYHGARLDEPGLTYPAPIATVSNAWSDRFVEYLLSKGADPNAGNPRLSHAIPLQAALIDQSADYFLPRLKRGEKYKTGETAAQVLGRFRRTVALLLDAGADPMRPGYYGKIPFQRACYWGETEMVRHMVRKGAKPNTAGPSAPGGFFGCSGYTALHCAVLRDSPENARTVRLLLASGADRGAKDDTGRTPLQLARHKGNRLVAEALIGR